VYGIKPRREMMNSNTEESTQNQSQKENDQEATENDESPRKRQKLIENQTKYNTDMINQTKRKQENKQPKFKIW